MKKPLIESLFTYHPPDGRQQAIYEELRKKGKELALYIDGHCPSNPDCDTAIIKLREAIMWANSSIANEEVW